MGETLLLLSCGAAFITLKFKSELDCTISEDTPRCMMVRLGNR